MKGRLIFLLLMVLIFSVQGREQYSNSIVLELTHRHAPQLNTRTKTQDQRLKDLLHHDFIRHNIISHKWRQGLQPRARTRRVQAWEQTPITTATTSNFTAAIEMPLGSGRDMGIGQYITSVKVGTPSQKFRLIVDTGSDLTWINCRYRCARSDNCPKKGRIKGRRVFHAHLSSSFRPVPCFSQMCMVELMNLFSLTTCPTPLTPCAYDYRYIDGSAAMGVFANETVTVSLTNGRKRRLHNVLIGCSDSFQSPTLQNVDGVIGLANSKYSFATNAAEKLGGKFSYCLVDHLSHINGSNYLIFGTNHNQVMVTGNTHYTRLELNLVSSFYAVNVMGISIGGKMLDIPFQVWDTTKGGGTILDSGTSLTVLTDPAYQPVMEAIKMSVSKYQKVKLDGVPMDYCFNSTGFDDTLVPKLIIHFADGARFEPHRKSYVIAAADGVRCLGFLPARFPGTSVIGNIMQQNYLWEFDLEGNKLGFAPSACSTS
ncbi:aspartic proteinase nepenthesin-1-like [Durio zibethinus]|uniref:Aspartic proteinase nepenthesin-1-like n=1 Tax=Durio zibethinus TaxID=66656 RepID=A0A6P5ZFE7_DURZI|nr:aspartic proteinase nepenthesin-1-like [Durio zibethinus]